MSRWNFFYVRAHRRVAVSLVVILLLLLQTFLGALVLFDHEEEQLSFEVVRAGHAEGQNSIQRLDSVLSYSLYGSSKRYTDGAIANSKLYRMIYPGWDMLVYHDNSVPANVLTSLLGNGVMLINMTGSKLAKSTWRFTAASDHHVLRVCSRDSDSRLSAREKAAVDEWIQSSKKFHVMRDHPSHSRRQHPMCAGMWCAVGDAIRDMTDRLYQHNLTDEYFQDQDFLSQVVWPFARESVLQHDSFSCDQYDGAIPFPTPRDGLEHVGSVYIDGKMRQEDVDVLKQATVPAACAKIRRD